MIWDTDAPNDQKREGKLNSVGSELLAKPPAALRVIVG
jgi:hypothetical protein